MAGFATGVTARPLPRCLRIQDQVCSLCVNRFGLVVLGRSRCTKESGAAIVVQLSSPRLITFLVSLVLAGLAAASLYIRIPPVGQYVVGHRVGFLMASYIVLGAGVLLRRL